jgi:hypothetical protein
VVVDDLNVARVARAPDETDSPLPVDANAVLTSPFTLEFLQAIGGWDSQVIEVSRSVQHAELSEGRSLDVSAEAFDSLALKQPLRIAVLEALDHVES